MLVGNRLGTFSEKFQRGELLGEGSFGKVYLCWVRGKKDELWALKELMKDNHACRWANHMLKNELLILKTM
jgi:serine/threonine protein kinase